MSVKENVTLEDVAKRAKVSRATVSRAVNTPESVSPEALKRINKAIADMHYVPNRHARALTGVRSKTIGLIFFHDINTLFESAFWGHVINPIYEKLSVLGYDLQIIAHAKMHTSKSGEDSGNEYSEDIAEKISEYNVDGFIVVGQTPKNLEVIFSQVRIPMIAFGAPLIPTSTVSWVDTDNKSGGRMAVDYLVSKKRKTIGMITGGLEQSWSVSRYEGYKKGLAKAGIEYDPSLVEHSSNTYANTMSLTERLMRRRHDINAIFAGNDEMAFAVIQTLKELNYSVGSDVLVIGFDNTNRTLQTFPNITTVGQDFEKIGEYLVTGLLQKMKGEKISSRKIAPKLIIRGSA
ncbi:transcriptional regulator [Candidatus Planktophila versatilis]|nr:transcriptional regulator [Candidatus Planktophila versatilis]